MPVQFDRARKVTGTLLVAFLVVALVVPACMTLACIVAPMSADGMMGGMTVSDCLDAAAMHDSLLAPDGSALLIATALVALLGLALMTTSSASLAVVGRAWTSYSVSPPSPLPPRGVRLLV